MKMHGTPTLVWDYSSQDLCNMSNGVCVSVLSSLLTMSVSTLPCHSGFKSEHKGVYAAAIGT